MRLGLEVSSAAQAQATGVARYITALITALQQLVEPADTLTLFYKLSRWRQRQSWWRPAGLPIRLYHGRWWPPVTSVEVVHGLDCVVPAWPRARRLVTVHDLLMLHSDDIGLAPQRFRAKKRQLYRQAMQRADAIVTVSDTTRQDLITHLGVPASRVHVTPLGLEPRFGQCPPAMVATVLRRYGLVPGYLLFTGAISGRKNTARLVQAYARCHARHERPLVLAGALSYHGHATLEAIRHSDLERHVRLLGYVPDADLPALYAGAGAFLFPTLYEGFGLPILEAMASGIPVLTSTTGAAPEISQGCAILVPPTDLDAIAAGIDRALEMPAPRLAQARAHAQTFTWERCARQTLALYRQVGGR